MERTVCATATCSDAQRRERVVDVEEGSQRAMGKVGGEDAKSWEYETVEYGYRGLRREE